MFPQIVCARWPRVSLNSTVKRRWLACGLSLLAAAAPCAGQEEGMQPGAAVPLEGAWKFTRDQGDSGEADGYADPGFDDSGWEEMRVPGAYNHQGPGYLGVVWYRRVITVPAGWKGGPVYLQLPPADDQDVTFWNGTKIGSMGPKQFTQPRLYRVPEAEIRWGERNVVAVKVTNKYMNGGFTTPGPACLLSRGAFLPFPPLGLAPLGDREMQLEATRDVEGKLGKSWILGWRDAGTADTRPKLLARPGPEAGTEALGFVITHPNASGEFADYNLKAQETGAIWQLREYDYIAFDYQTDETEGEMRLYLNAGGWKWGKDNSGFGTHFQVRKGQWTSVVLPFAEFHGLKPRIITYLPNLNQVKTFSLGYRNNEMRSAGEVKFANFRVGRFQEREESVKLDGLWHLGRGDEAAAAAAADFRAWPTVATGFSWAAQKIREPQGIFWLKQEVLISATWEGTQLRLQLGKLRSAKDSAEVFVNGIKMGGTGSHDMKLDISVPPAAFTAGQLNTVAVQIVTGNAPFIGLMDGPFTIQRQSVWLAMRDAGSAEAPVISADFDPGPVAGVKKYELFLRTPAEIGSREGQRVSYAIRDCFHRTVKEGEGSLRAVAGKHYLELPVALDEAESRQLYFSEYFQLRIRVETSSGEPVYLATQLKVEMKYDSRDNHVREAYPDTWEETPYGKLKLVDAIDAAEDPGRAGHVYKQGGHRESWVGRRAYASWVNGVTIEEFQGKRYREANNNEWFGYRVGRGKIVPGKAYLVRVEYPEDKTRYVPINIDTGRNYQGLGFRSGVGTDDPFDNYPLSGKYQFFDTVVIPDEVTYGSKGSRKTPADKGFWIFFFDNGRAYTPEYQAGPAVSRILVYEMPEGKAAHPIIRYPRDAPRRYFIADWEREPEWVARDMAHHALISGYNGISPSILKWGNLAFWHVKDTEKLPLKPVRPVREDLPPDEESALEKYLKASKEAGITIFPRLEYGGTNALPQEARAIGAGGKPAKPNRFHSWCSNLLKPQVMEEFTEILDQVVGDNIQDNPQIGGILFRIRSDRLPISYGPDDVAMYASETGDIPPAGLEGAELSKWASDPARHQKYADWWHVKRRDFHARIVARLKEYRPDLQMLYYNWDPDRWNLGAHHRSPEDYRDSYNVHTSIEYYKRKAAYQAAIPADEYVRMVRDMGAPHHQVRPDLYADLPGFALLGPFNWRYLAENPAYINYFRTGNQLALTKLFDYEERGRWNVQNDNYETSELTTGGPDFAMAEQVLSVFHGDPWILTETAYTYGGGFMEKHREFAQAFLALPAVPGEVIETPGIANAGKLKVRRHQAGGQVYLSITHKGHAPESFLLEIPGSWGAAVTLTDQVSGQPVPVEIREGKLHFQVNLPPMVLKSYLVQPAP